MIMPDHVHLLLSEPQLDTLADALKSLKQGVSRRLIGKAEHFWQKRYYDFNIRNYPQFVEKLRYIHCNPVRRGLCEHPQDLEWSSFRHYATRFEGRVEIESEWTARKRERAAGRLFAAVELKPKPGLNGPPARVPLSNQGWQQARRVAGQQRVQV
jgi:putative transposase